MLLLAVVENRYLIARSRTLSWEMESVHPQLQMIDCVLATVPLPHAERMGNGPAICYCCVEISGYLVSITVNRNIQAGKYLECINSMGDRAAKSDTILIAV